MYRRRGAALEVLLVHPGGPFWRNKDFGAWSIPKGGLGEGEDAEAAARREFAEELGGAAVGPVAPLGEVRQRGGKRVTGFALQGDLDVAAVISNAFELEWPPRSGRVQSYPEVDRAGWFTLAEARDKILAAQRPFLDRLAAALAGTP